MAGLDPYVGLTALLAAQRGLDVVGNNVANANTPGYTRQVVQLAEAPAIDATHGQIGSGVQVLGVERVADAFLDGRVRDAAATNAADSAEAERLNEVQGILGTTGTGTLSSLLSSYYASAQALAASPADRGARTQYVASAQGLAHGLNGARAALESERSDIAAEVKQDVAQANGLAKQVGSLNAQIQQVQSRGETANALVDQRDQVVRQLAQLLGAEGVSRPDGTMDVSAGGQLLVSGTNASTLETAQDPRLGTVVRYAGSTATAAIGTGTVGGLLAATNATIPGLEGQLDQLALGVATQANSVNATGVPASGPMTSLATTIPVQDVNGSGSPTDDVLARAGLPSTPGAGTILVNVTDLATKAVTTTKVAFDPASQSLSGLATALSAVPGVTATAGADGILRISAAPGQAFDFGDRAGAGGSDAGGILGALGAQPIFTGSTAATIAVAANVVANPGAVAAGSGPDGGDGSNAARLADQPVAALGNASPSQFLASLVASAGTQAADASTRQQGSGQSLKTLEDARTGLSGVSTEEEVANMIQFQNSFQAASQLLAVVDKLTQTLMGIVGH